MIRPQQKPVVTTTLHVPEHADSAYLVLYVALRQVSPTAIPPGEWTDAPCLSPFAPFAVTPPVTGGYDGDERCPDCGADERTGCYCWMLGGAL